MAVYIYVTRYDEVGEGVRASLESYNSRDEAHTQMLAYQADEDVISAAVIVGSIVEEHNA